MLRQNLPSTEIEREENSQAALLLRDAADIEALRVAYRAVVTASAHSVFSEKVLPGEAKQPPEPLLSAYQAAVAAFANSVFQSTGTPAFEPTRLNPDVEALLHPINQPAITAQLEPSLEPPLNIADEDIADEISEISQCVEPETVQEAEAFNFNLKTEESASATSAQAPGRRLKVALRREYGPYAATDSTQADFRPAYRNAASQVNETILAPVSEISETIQPTSVTIAPAVNNVPEAPLPAIAVVSAALSAQLAQVIQEVSFKIPVENPTSEAAMSEPAITASRESDIRTAPENAEPAVDPAIKPATRSVPRPHLSFYAFHEQSAWSIPLKKTALPDTMPVMSVEPEIPFEPVEKPAAPALSQTEIPSVTNKETAMSPEALPEAIEGIQAEYAPEISTLTDEAEALEENLLEDLPPNPESWLVKALSRPKLVAGAAGFCILASALSAMLNYWWLNGNTSGAAGNVAEAVEPFGMLNVQEEEPARKEQTTGQFQHLQQLQNHPDAEQNHAAPAKPERQGTLIAQAHPSEQPRHTASSARFRSNVVEPTGRPDPFAPLLSETDGGSGFGESASTPAPVKKDILTELQYTGFIGDISAKDKVAIIKIQDAQAGVTRTLIKKVGETFSVDGERVMLQGISRHALSLSVSGRTRSLELSPYVELTASSDAGGSTQQGGGGTASSGRRNPANPALEEPGQ